MNIHIQVLGPKWQGALIQRRTTLPIGAARFQIRQSDYDKTVRVGPLGRWWTRGLGLSSPAIEAGLSALRRSGSGWMSLFLSAVTVAGTVGFVETLAQNDFPLATLTTAVLGMGAAGLWLAYPKVEIWNVVRKPVTEEEISALKGAIQDPLEQSYLGLVQEIRQQSLTPGPLPELRGAIRALGQALGQLPPCGAVANVCALRETSAQKRAEAVLEADPVVAASLQRQADALRRSAETAERSARLMRRTAVLRDEMSAQIESLRLGLNSFQTDPDDMSSLSELAEAVQTVALQTASVAEARAELDIALEGSRSMSSQSMPQTLFAGEI